MQSGIEHSSSVPRPERDNNRHVGNGSQSVEDIHNHPSCVLVSKGSPRHPIFVKLLSFFVGQSKNKSVTCLACQDSFGGKACFRASCGHYYCPECTVGMATTAVAEGNESFFPLRCCEKPFPLKNFLKLLPKPLRESVVQKSKETSIPPTLRLYCPNDPCSAFLGKSPRKRKAVICPRCHIKVCSSCKRIYHSQRPCEPEELPPDVKNLTVEKGWKVCPGCSVIVERTGGCPEMSCRCGTRFCYGCGRRLGQCQCPSPSLRTAPSTPSIVPLASSPSLQRIDTPMPSSSLASFS